MSRYLNGNNEPVIDDYSACTFKLDDSCTCEFVPYWMQAGHECSVCRFFKRETGAEKLEDPKCKWLEEEVCCNGDCPMVGDFPLDACIVCKWWENETL